MALDVETKIQKLKNVLGKDAVESALTEAEKREKAADEAGIESKELGGVTTKAEEVEAVSLSDLLAEVEAGLQDGTIVDDTEDVAEDGEEEVVDDGPTKEELKEFDAYVTGLVDARMKENLLKLETKFKESFVPRQKERDAVIGDLETKLKETVKQSQALQAQIDELVGLQPKNRRNGYRASEDEKTLVKEGSHLKEARPAADPMGDFIAGLNIGS